MTQIPQDICLDNFLGKNKAPAIPINLPVEEPGLRKVCLCGTRCPKKLDSFSQKFSSKKYGGQTGRLDPVIQHASQLPKPQLLFKRKHDNSDSPWRPTLSHKYNAKVPSGYIYHDPDMEYTTV